MTYTLILWNHEAYYESPARRSFNVSWTGNLTYAHLSIDVDPYLPGIGGGCVTRVLLNGNEINVVGDKCNIMTADVRNVLRNGANYIEIYHNANPIPGIQSGGMYVTLTFQADGGESGDVVPNPPSGGFDLNFIIILIVIVGILLLIVR